MAARTSADVASEAGSSAQLNSAADRSAFISARPAGGSGAGCAGGGGSGGGGGSRPGRASGDAVRGRVGRLARAEAAGRGQPLRRRCPWQCRQPRQAGPRPYRQGHSRRRRPQRHAARRRPTAAAHEQGGQGQQGGTPPAPPACGRAHWQAAARWGREPHVAPPQASALPWAAPHQAASVNRRHRRHRAGACRTRYHWSPPSDARRVVQHGPCGGPSRGAGRGGGHGPVTPWGRPGQRTTAIRCGGVLVSTDKATHDVPPSKRSTRGSCEKEGSAAGAGA